MPSTWTIQSWPRVTSHVFLSHCAEDRGGLVVPAFERLRQQRIIPWIDRHHYPAGRLAGEVLPRNSVDVATSFTSLRVPSCGRGAGGQPWSGPWRGSSKTNSRSTGRSSSTSNCRCCLWIQPIRSCHARCGSRSWRNPRSTRPQEAHARRVSPGPCEDLGVRRTRIPLGRGY